MSSQSQKFQLDSYNEEETLDKLRIQNFNLNQCVKLCQILRKDDEQVAPELLRYLHNLSTDLSSNFDHMNDSNFYELDCSDEDTVAVSSLCKLITCLESLARNFSAKKRSTSVVSQLITLFLDTIRRIYSFVLKQDLNTTSANHIKSSQLTQFLTSNSSNTQLINMYKNITEYLTLISGLIDSVLFTEENLNEFITICNSLLELIRLSKDAKSLLFLWKLVSKYLIKYRAMIVAANLSSFSSFDYLNICYESITMNFQYIRLNLDAIFKEFCDEVSVKQPEFDAEIENAANLVKLVKLCGFLFKVFKTILVNFYEASDETHRIVSSLLIELMYLLTYTRFPSSVSSISLHFKFYAEFNSVIDAVHMFLMNTSEFKAFLMQELFNSDLDKVKLTLYIVSLLPLFDAHESENNLRVFYKLFELVEFCLIEFNRPISIVIPSKSSADIQRKDDLAQINFEAHFILSLSRFIATKIEDKNAILLALVYFTVYGSCKQSQIATELLLVLIKLMLLSNNSKNCFGFYKIIFEIYEQTQNLSLKILIRHLFELIDKNTQANAKLKLYEYLVKESWRRVLAIFYQIFSNNVSPKCDANFESVKSALISNLDSCLFVETSSNVLNKKMIIECVEHMSLLTKSKQLADENVERLFDCNFDEMLMQQTNNSDTMLIETDASLSESEQSSKLLIFKLIKTLKVFNLNKYSSGKLNKGSKIAVNTFLCEIYVLLVRYFNYATNSSFQMTRTLMFLLNFIQQFAISENDIIDFKLQAAFFLASLANKDFSRNSKQYSDADSDMNVDEKDERTILEKIMTLFCFLLNDENRIVNNLALEALNEFINKNVNQNSADYVLTEIIRSNFKMKELVGNYLRKVPYSKTTCSDHFEILTARLQRRIVASDEDAYELDDDKRDEINELFKNCETCLASLLVAYRELNRPTWIKTRLEALQSKLNDN